MKMFCPACGDIRQTAEMVNYRKSKKVFVIYCGECGYGFLYSQLSKKQIDKILAQNKKKAEENNV